MKWLLLLAVVGQYYAKDYSPPPTPKLWENLNPTDSVNQSWNIEWMQDAPSINDIHWYIYRIYFDNLPAKQLGRPQCLGDYRPFKCSSPIGSYNTRPGKHRIQITVSMFISGDSVEYPSRTGEESEKSNTFEFIVRQPKPRMYGGGLDGSPESKAQVVIR